MKIVWECGFCGSTQESDSKERWQMDHCDCGKSAVDLEESYQRTMGSVKVIKIDEDESGK